MLVFLLYAVDENGESTCSDDVRRCSGSPGESIVKELVSNNDQFVEEFIDVFTKMIEKVSFFKIYRYKI